MSVSYIIMYLQKIKASRDKASMLESELFALKIQLSPDIVALNKERILRNQTKIPLSQNIPDNSQSPIDNSKQSLDISPSEPQPSKLVPSQSNNASDYCEGDSMEIPIPKTNPHFTQLQDKEDKGGQGSSSSLEIPLRKSLDILKSWGSQLNKSEQFLDNETFSRIEQIISDTKSHCLQLLKNFSADSLLSSEGEYRTKDPFRSCIFYLIDMIFSDNKKSQLQNSILKTTLEKLKVEIKPQILKILHKYLGTQTQELTQDNQRQVRRSFMDYYILKLEKPEVPIFKVMEEYGILEAVIEIIGLNFVSRKLQDKGGKTLENFLEEYFNEDGDPEVIFKRLSEVFEFELEIQKNPSCYIFKEDSGDLRVEVETSVEESFVSYREPK